MKVVARAGVVLALMPIVAACSGGKSGSYKVNDPPNSLTVGGAVYTPLEGEADLPLAGVTVTLTDETGESETATTSAAGLYEMGDVAEGVYGISYALTGYDTVSFVITVSAAEENGFAVAADDDDDGGSTPSYEFLGTTYLSETSMTATVAPFTVSVADSEYPVDGTAGATIEYDVSTAADVVVTFSRPLATNGVPYIQNGVTFSTLYPSSISTDNTTYTFSGANVAAVVPTTGVLHRLELQSLASYTPINGTYQSYYSTIRFRSVP